MALLHMLFCAKYVQITPKDYGKGIFRMAFKRSLLLTGILALVFLGGCDNQVKAEPVKWPENGGIAEAVQQEGRFQLVEDVCYQKTEGDQCYMDLAYYENGIKKPLMVCIHGGSWSYGSKESMRKLLEVFSEEGYVVAGVDYDVLPDATIIEQQECIKKALDYIISLKDTYEIDSDRVILVGSSAGAQLALRVTEEIAENSEDYAFHIGAVVDLFGPADFNYFMEKGSLNANNMDSVLKMIEDDEDTDLEAAIKKIDVSQNISVDMPPVLIIHGIEDKNLPIEVSERFYQKLQKEGVPSKLVKIQRMGHELYWDKIIPEIRKFLANT